MYLPPHFKAEDEALTRHLIAANAFGILSVPSVPDAITHLPMVLIDGETPTLIGHVAKANPVWRAFDGETGAVAIFSGPHAYLSPNWYVSENMVPTWNYAAVHAFGAPRALTDDDAADVVLQKLVAAFESDATGNWSMAGLDPEFRKRQLKGIVAFEMPVTRFETKVKMSQNRGMPDVLGAAAGLEGMSDPIAHATASMMRGLNRDRA